MIKLKSFLRGLSAAALCAAAISSHASVISFDVFARANSLAFVTRDAAPLDTGLFYNPGDLLNITASGLWAGGACGTGGPTGIPSCGTDTDSNGVSYFTLIGQIGAGDVFYIGDSFTGNAMAAGNLFLSFYDGDSANNSGFVTAVVTRADVPEPASLALIGLGLAGLAASRRRKQS